MLPPQRGCPANAARCPLQSRRDLVHDRGQAAINFCVFTTMAVTSFASGALVTTQGWTWLNYGSLVPVMLFAVSLAWLLWRRNKPL